ncbi:MAG: glycosyltransferase [Gemmataceae bacterium]|nr:glycosyltransferase [Gemmataceae bacterium]
MSVLHVVPSLDGRSWTRDLEILARRLPAESMRIFCLGDLGPAGEALMAGDANVELRDSRRVLDPALLWRLRTLIRDMAPTAIHAWGMSALRAIAASQFSALRRAIVSTPLPPRPRDMSFFDRWLLRQVATVVARTEAEASALRSVGVAATSIRLTPPGIEPFSEHQPNTERPAAILGIGRLEPHKGFRDAIWTHDVLVQVFPAMRIRLVGEGSVREDLLRFATAMNNPNVELVGEVPRPETYAEDADFGFALSHGGFGCRSVLEMMAAGIPVIASDLPHHRELIADGETGCLTPIGEKIHPARRVRALMHDPAAAKRIGDAARRAVADRFAADGFADRMAARYARRESAFVVMRADGDALGTP